jgi:hydrogenase nickel incorporation protein HypA/HybF
MPEGVNECLLHRFGAAAGPVARGLTSVCSNSERHPVHELSVCEAIVGTAVQRAGGRPVTQVTVRIGHLRQVVPDALQFGWEMLTDDTDLKGCRLVIEQIPAKVACRACQSETTLDLPVLMCGACESFDVSLLSGEEFLLVSMEVTEV